MRLSPPALYTIFSIGIIGLMALQSSTKSTPSAAPAVAASQKERLAQPVKQTAGTQNEVQPTQKRKAAQVTRKRNDEVTHRRKEEAPTFSSGSSGYGFAAEPRRFYQYPPLFFGR